MKIGVLGAKGRLGNELLKRNCIGINTDITNLASLEHCNLSQYDAIINCAAKTGVDWCEKNIIPAYTINGFAIENIIKQYNGYFIQISTDYVFDGIAGPYTELDTPNPIQTYGFSKWVGEQMVARLFQRYLIIRTTNLYDNGNSGKSNFVLEAINNLKQGKVVKVTPELYGNPTYTPELADWILLAIEKQITGKLNLVGETVCNRYELMRQVANLFGYDDGLVMKAKFWADAKRPERNGLKVNRATELGIPITDMFTGIIKLKESLLG
jgi:dTDP-4-dehydrorhamnose reductase